MRVVSVACGSPVVWQQGVNVVMPGGAEAGDYSVPTKSAKDISAEDIGHWLPATGCASCRASHGLHRPSPADGQPSHVAEGNVLTSRGATSSRVGQTFVARVARAEWHKRAAAITCVARHSKQRRFSRGSRMLRGVGESKTGRGMKNWEPDNQSLTPCV